MAEHEKNTWLTNLIVDIEWKGKIFMAKSLNTKFIQSLDFYSDMMRAAYCKFAAVFN